MKNISVIGAGQMGNGIAHVFAQAGHSVTLIDLAQERLDKAVATIGKTACAKPAPRMKITKNVDVASTTAASSFTPYQPKSTVSVTCSAICAK